MKRGVWSGLAFAVLLGARAVAAAPTTPTPAPGDLAVDVAPILGNTGAMALGWNEVVVSIRSNAGKPIRGRIDVTSSHAFYNLRPFRTSAAFAVGAGASVTARVPVVAPSYGDLSVTVVDEEERVRSETQLPALDPSGVTLLDVGEASRLRGAIDGVAAAPLFEPRSSARGVGPTVTVAGVRYDPTTGDPVLPDRAPVYTSADAVLVRSDVLARVQGPELDALAGHVLAGGTIAIAIVRPEDARHPVVAAFAGGDVTRTRVSPATLAELVLPSPTGLVGGKGLPRARAPTSELDETLAGWAGGNLRPSLYGSSAAYGLGEVHLLAFDPTRKPALDDPWALARMVDLTRRAFDRRSTQVFRPGGDSTNASPDRVRRLLDPNEHSRWAIAAAALLLIAYAVVAGPVNFALAARSGRPLRALRRLPLLSAAAFALVVGIGSAAKGFVGRARHLTLIEAGAGMSKGSARRYRAFYTSGARELTISATDASSALLTATPDSTDRVDHLVVDRDGARLVEVGALPWQTVVIREDGLAALGDGIAIVNDGETGITVINRTGRDLRGALLRTPRGPTFYFARIPDGDRVATSAGRDLHTDPDGRVWESAVGRVAWAGRLSFRALEADSLTPILEPDAPGLAAAWWALSDAAGPRVDWFPDDVPVLLAQLDGGEGRMIKDAGIRIDSDRLLVRVVGFGGRP
jgi:hypothetical protein